MRRLTLTLASLSAVLIAMAIGCMIFILAGTDALAPLRTPGALSLLRAAGG